MELTTEVVQRFVGGQMEIQNEEEGYLYRGEIQTIVVEVGELRVTFNWVAKGEGYPPLPKEWINDDHRDYAIPLRFCVVSDIGPSGGDIGGDNRLCVGYSIMGEMVILYPPNGSKLDPAQIRGLDLTKK